MQEGTSKAVYSEMAPWENHRGGNQVLVSAFSIPYRNQLGSHGTNIIVR